MVEMVSGRHQVELRVIQVQRAARRELGCLYTAPRLEPPGAERVMREALAEGVTCRALYQSADLARPGVLPPVESLDHPAPGTSP
ncbi:hypothetical protein [Bailinhaonella thermotolerans]|uniref:Uncharacterized protein n=1 Tax=Bailinhaonella thermotolerans TaxID=1070861 RepID=A0A3A4BVG5_9ACTN|nr:hypothetical protein [Bailinhaonella thermotolerans]RJL35588.1 hypothetical protein D5H75_01985 [Bailinhaonella thermotolerans]